MDNIGIQLSENIIELLTTYDYNCENVERHALNTVVSCEVAVFNCLRDITAHNILLALNRLDVWFGPEPSLEHCICLTVLTEYISCAYGEKTLYKTFETASSGKFLKTLFSRLCEEWARMFHSKIFYQYSSSSELQSIRRILQDSINRFPANFRFKRTFDYISHLCKNNGISEEVLTVSQNIQPHVDFKSKPKSISRDLNSYITKDVSQNVKGSQSASHQVISMKSDVKNVAQVSKENQRVIGLTKMMLMSKNNQDMVRNTIRKENTISQDCKNNNALAKPLKAVLNAGVDQNKKEVSKHFQNKARNINKTLTVQNADIKEIPCGKPKIINAFDVLMKRSGAGLKRKATF